MNRSFDASTIKVKLARVSFSLKLQFLEVPTRGVGCPFSDASA